MTKVIEPLQDWKTFSESFFEAQNKLGYFGLVNAKQGTPSLLYRNLQYNTWKPVQHWLEDLSSDEDSMSSGFLLDNIGFHLREILEKNTQWEKKFYQKTAHLPFVKKAFYEVGTDPDFALKNSWLSFQYYRNSLNPNDVFFENDSLYIDTLESLYLFKKKNTKALEFCEMVLAKYAHIIAPDEEIHIFNLTRLWILELYRAKWKKERFSHFNWIAFQDRIQALWPGLDTFQKRVQQFMVLDACLQLKVPKTIVVSLIQLLGLPEMTVYSEDKLRYYLKQIDPNGTRWRKQFHHF